MCRQPCSPRCPPKGTLSTLLVACEEAQWMACSLCITKTWPNQAHRNNCPAMISWTCMDLFGRLSCRAVPPMTTRAGCCRLPMRSPCTQSKPSAPPNLQTLRAALGHVRRRCWRAKRMHAAQRHSPHPPTYSGMPNLIIRHDWLQDVFPTIPDHL
jgi:hypothetical protein